METKRGEIPKEIWEEKELQEYVGKGIVFGYLGHTQRTNKADKYTCGVAKELGYTQEQIATFLCSRPGRHYGDQLPNSKQITKVWVRENLPSFLEWMFPPSTKKARLEQLKNKKAKIEREIRALEKEAD